MHLVLLRLRKTPAIKRPYLPLVLKKPLIALLLNSGSILGAWVVVLRPSCLPLVLKLTTCRVVKPSRVLTTMNSTDTRISRTTARRTTCVTEDPTYNDTTALQVSHIIHTLNFTYVIFYSYLLHEFILRRSSGICILAQNKRVK